MALLAAAGMAAILLWLGLPSLIASLCLLPAQAGIEAMRHGRLLVPDAYARVIASHEAAARWQDRPDAEKELGQVYFHLARMAESAGAIPAVDGLALSWLRRGLARAPVDPDGWARLAFLHDRLGESEAARRALDLSLATGPYEPDLTLPRAQLALRLWDGLDPAARARATPELRRALERQPDRLAAAIRSEGGEAALRAALGQEPAMLARLGAALAAAGAAPPAVTPGLPP